jgi:hypothetical protein
MENFATTLHKSILDNVIASNWDTFGNMYNSNGIDPLVAQCVKLQSDKIVEKKKGRGKFAFTEEYWRQWNADLIILDTVSKREQIAAPKVKKIAPLRVSPNKNVVSHSFGDGKSSVLRPNVYKSKKTIKMLREQAGKSIKVPKPIDLEYIPKISYKGGCFSTIANGMQIVKPITQLCEVPPLDKINSTSRGGTPFGKASRFPRLVDNPSNSQSRNASPTQLDAQYKESGSRPSTSGSNIPPNAISFPMEDRFRDHSNGAVSNPGPGAYDVRYFRIKFVCCAYQIFLANTDKSHV